MTTDFGRDLWCRRYLVTTREATGIDVLKNALFRRLSTPRGRLSYHRDYGLDMTGLIGSEITHGTLPRLEADVVDQVEADPRVIEGTVSAKASEVRGATGSTITVEVRGDSAAGPFDFVVPVGGVTLAILGVQEDD